mgnify:CR=1 FL=1
MIMSNKPETVTLTGTTLFFSRVHYPKLDLGGLEYSVKLGVTQEHVNQLTSLGVSTKTARGTDRFRPLIWQGNTLANISLACRRKAKSNHVATDDPTKADNNIKVTFTDGTPMTDGIGNGSTGNVTFLIRRENTGVYAHIGSIVITDYIPYSRQDTQNSSTQASVDEAVANLKSMQTGS